MNTRLINSVDSDHYKTFLKNYDFIRRNIGTRRIRQDTINRMFESLGNIREPDPSEEHIEPMEV